MLLAFSSGSQVTWWQSHTLLALAHTIVPALIIRWCIERKLILAIATSIKVPAPSKGDATACLTAMIHCDLFVQISVTCV